MCSMPSAKEAEKLLEAIDCLSMIIVEWNEEISAVCENINAITLLLDKLGLSTSPLVLKQHSCKVNRPDIFCFTSIFVQDSVLILKHIVQVWSRCPAIELDQFLPLAQVKRLSAIMFFIVKFGLVRHFNFSSITHVSQYVTTKPPCSTPHLLLTCKTIMECCDNRAVKDLFLKNHLCDLLGGLIQLAYSPDCRQYVDKADRKMCVAHLTQAITKWTSLSDVVRNLIVLQGSATRPAPAWMSKTCGMLLSKCLLLSGGVIAVLLACMKILDEDLSEWKKAEVVSNILCVPPTSHSNVEHYVENICAQFLSIIQTDKQEFVSQLFDQMLVSSMLTLYKQYPSIVQNHLVMKLLLPLERCCVGASRTSLNCSSGITTSVEFLHKVLVPFKHPHKDVFMSDIVIPLIKVLFQIYKRTQNTVSHLQTLTKDILIKCLTCTKHDVACIILLCISDIEISLKMPQIKDMRPNIMFQLNHDGRLEATECEQQSLSPEIHIADQDKCVQSVLALLQESKDSQLLVKFFLSLLRNLGDTSFYISQSESVDLLSTANEKTVQQLSAGKRELIAYALLLAILEISDSLELFSEIEEICGFVKVMLERLVDGVINETSHESLQFCCAVLGLCLLSETKQKQHAVMKELVPLLQRASKLDSLDSVERETLSDVAVAIATHGSTNNVDLSLFSSTLQDQAKVWQEKRDGKAPTLAKKGLGLHQEHPCKSADAAHSSVPNPKPLIEELSADSNSTLPCDESRLQQDEIQKNLCANSYASAKEAMEEIYDPSPANRTAAVRYLTKLVNSRHATVSGMSLQLYQMFLNCLNTEQESFVYLSLVQGLAEIVNSETLSKSQLDSLVGHLINDYEKCLLLPADNDVEKVVKLGEVIVRFIQQLGDLAPYYGPQLINIFLYGARDKHSVIRASCISNLAELCTLLKQYIPGVEHELSQCLCAIASTDHDAIARQAAAHALKTLIVSYGQDILPIFSGSIKHIYKVLKQLYEKDTDHSVKIHAQLALEQLDSIMRHVIFVKPQNQSKSPKKSIVVLSNN